MTEKTIEQALSAAANEVLAEFKDGIIRTFTGKEQSGLEWRVDFVYFDFQWVTPLVIKEDYGHVPDHESLKATMRAHLLADPPKPQN